MLHPSITDYIDTLENPAEVFSTLGEVAVERDIYGTPQLRAGNSAAIFTYRGDDGHRRFLKCYIRPNRHLRTVYEYVERLRPALLPDVRLLKEEMFVHTVGGGAGWVDVVEGEWLPGENLAAAVARAVRDDDTTRLERLADAFDVLYAELAAAEWAHGDLKPENIIVGREGGMTLIDCDAMWVPALAGQRAVELGTPGYRHPARTAADFDKTIDDYPARLISAHLRTLAMQPDLRTTYTTFEELVARNEVVF